jgi:cobalamin synthase
MKLKVDHRIAVTVYVLMAMASFLSFGLMVAVIMFVAMLWAARRVNKTKQLDGETIGLAILWVGLLVFVSVATIWSYHVPFIS